MPDKLTRAQLLAELRSSRILHGKESQTKKNKILDVYEAFEAQSHKQKKHPNMRTSFRQIFHKKPPGPFE